jgi:hypothetical protein
VKGDIVTGNATTWSPRDDGRFLRVLSYIEPTLWSTCQCGVELASRGTEVVGNLSPETLNCVSIVRGVTADIKLLPSDKIPMPNRNDGHEWTVFVDEPVSQRSEWTIDAYIEGKQLLTGNWSATLKDDRYLNYWSLDSEVCPTVEVRRTLHDFRVRFDGIAAHAGSITSPRVDYVGPVQKK